MADAHTIDHYAVSSYLFKSPFHVMNTVCCFSSWLIVHFYHEQSTGTICQQIEHTHNYLNTCGGTYMRNVFFITVCQLNFIQKRDLADLNQTGRSSIETGQHRPLPDETVATAIAIPGVHSSNSARGYARIAETLQARQPKQRWWMFL